METIASFQVNHEYLKKGLYTSRVDGDIVTYDVRMKLPNGGDYLENNQVHTFEHLFAVYTRNTPLSQGIIYVGPMGCLTGFYFLVRDSITPQEVIALLQDTFKYIGDFKGKIPGRSDKECGNALGHDLGKAQALGKEMSLVLEGWTADMLDYSYHEPL